MRRNDLPSYRPVPGWPRHRAGSDGSVWFNRADPSRPPPWDRAQWVRLRAYSKSGVGPVVEMRHGGGRCVRSVARLVRAAFAAECDRAGWAVRLGPPPPRAVPVAGPAAGSPAIAPAPPDPAPVAGGPLRAGSAGQTPGVECRMIGGFPGYRIGPDRSVWSCRRSNGRPGDPPAWRRLTPCERRGHAPTVTLSRDGRPHSRSVAKLHRAAFPAPGPVDLLGLGPASRGSDHGSAKLDEAKVIEARRLKAEGWTYPELVARYGVGKVTLFYAVTGRTWRHVPMTADGPR